LLPLAKNSAALVDQMNLLFCGNSMTAATRTQILAGIQALPASADDTAKVQTALHLTIFSPEGAFQK
jgi:hypothetical protein